MTVIYAHRGYSAAYPENTMIAFQKAIENGADGIEMDVQLTKDGEIVVIHDLTVDRTTNGTGFVKDFTLREIQLLEANYVFEQTPPPTIPTLQQFFEWLVTNDLFCIIELKNNVISYEGLEEGVIRFIYAYELQDRVILSSFNHYSLVRIHQMAPELETAPLYRDGLFMPWIYARAIHAKGIHPSYVVASNEVIKQSLDEGIKVRPFTVNKEKELRRFFQVNCTAVITDELVEAVKIRREIQDKP